MYFLHFSDVRAPLTPRALSIYIYGLPLTELIHTTSRGDSWSPIVPPYYTITLFPDKRSWFPW